MLWGNARICQATNQLRVDGYVDCYEEDGWVMHPGSPAVRGHAAIRDHVAGMFTVMRVTKLVLTSVAVDGSPSLAYDTGTQVLEVEPALEGFGSRREVPTRRTKTIGRAVEDRGSNVERRRLVVRF